ncbi:hypothetical protein LEMLEM_LOCUS27062 [Lemmus lemmus]
MKLTEAPTMASSRSAAGGGARISLRMGPTFAGYTALIC